MEKKDIQDLMDLYNRGGFSTGYYQRYHGVSMMSMKRQNHYGTEGAMLLEQRKRRTAYFLKHWKICKKVICWSPQRWRKM